MFLSMFPLILSFFHLACQVGEIIMLCRALEFAQRPDYEAYRALLEKMRDRKVSRMPRLCILFDRTALYLQRNVKCFIECDRHCCT